jgi:fatty-acyl-CoA synthase
VLREHFDAGAVLETIERERITHLCVVEPWLVELADHPDVDRRELSSLVAISHIGAAAAPSLRRRILRRLGPVLAHPYGASEAGIVCLLAGAEYSLERPELLGTVGRPLPGAQVFVERSDGTDAAVGEPGLVAVRSTGIAAGYIVAPADSGFRNGKYYTGDIALFDAEGYVHLRGRAKDARRFGARTVFPVDVQDALCEHPEVRYAVAVPTETGFLAAVLLRSGATVGSAELRDWLATRGEVVPETFLFLDRMPVTEQGKPDRNAITALVAG